MHHYNRPEPALAPYVKTVLVIDCVADKRSLPVIPQGTPALICALTPDKKDKKPVRLRLFGKSVNSGAFMELQGACVVAYFFKPFVVAPLFDIPIAKLTDHPIELLEGGQREVATFPKKLAEAKTPSEHMALFDRFLIDRLNRNKDKCEIIRIANDRIMSRPGTVILSSILIELRITERTLQRVFKKYLGVTPSQFRRLCQFHSAFDQLRHGRFTRLSDIAYDQGYADQSHFGRSFREFTSLSPHEYMRLGLPENAPGPR